MDTMRQVSGICVPFQVIRIAASIPFLLVIMGDRLCQADKFNI